MSDIGKYPGGAEGAQERPSSPAGLPVVQAVPGRLQGQVPGPLLPWNELPEEAEGVNLRGLLHSLRRQWLLGGLLGAAIATLLAALIWLVIPEDYEAVCLLRVRREQQAMLGGQTVGGSPNDYNTYKQTQSGLIKSPFVISAALRIPGISQLPMVRREGNPVAWLTDALRVTITGESEILRVSLRGEDTEQIIKLVNAVKDAFLEEIVQAERTERLVRLDVLKQGFQRNVNEIKQKSDTFYNLAEQLGTSDTELARIKQQLAMNELAALKSERDSLERRLRDVSVDSVLARTSLENNLYQPSEFAIEDELERDLTYVARKQELQELQQQYALVAASVRSGSPALQRMQAQFASAQAAFDRLRAELRPRIVDRLRRGTGLATGDNLQLLVLRDTERELISRELERARAAYEQQSQAVQKLGGVSVDLLTRADELEQLKQITSRMKAEIDGLELDLQRPPRVQLIQEAIVPDESNFRVKILEVGASWLAVFLLTVGVAVLLDYQKRRVNAAEDLPPAAAIRVIGSLPLLDRRGPAAWWPLGRTDQRSLEAVLIDSIDSIRTALLYDRMSGSRQVVLVTSAAAEEGRTTLASQLALSLARSGRRTLLVDGDLRNPGQHAVFGIPRNHGFCELLRGEADDHQVIQSAGVDGLWLITAGAYDEATARGLAEGGVVREIFARLRSQYDLIVLDSGPVLSSAEPLLLGQCVDTTMVSVRCDVSQSSKINAACERMRAVGIPLLGAVVHGTGTELRRSELRLAAAPATA